MLQSGEIPLGPPLLKEEDKQDLCFGYSSVNLCYRPKAMRSLSILFDSIIEHIPRKRIGYKNIYDMVYQF